MGRVSRLSACLCVCLCALSATVVGLSVGQNDLSKRQSAVAGLTAAEFAANATLWQKQRECLEFCGEHGVCENGACKCEQPFCGQYCTRQCQHGGTCNVGPNRCLCGAGWAGEFCEIQEPSLDVDDSATKQKAKTHGKLLMARVLEGGRLPVEADNGEACNRALGTLNVPFPADIDLAQVVSVSVMCIDAVRRKMYFGVNDPLASPVAYGSAETCKKGTNDLMHDTFVSPRYTSTDFRYHMEDGNIVVEKLGLSPELERCTIRATVTYFG